MILSICNLLPRSGFPQLSKSGILAVRLSTHAIEGGLVMEQSFVRRIVFLFLSVVLCNGPGVLRAEEKPATPQPAPPSMSKEELNAFLARPIIARIATVRENETPQLAPMWFLYENWLQVLAFTKLPEVDEGERDKFEPKMMTLFGLKEQQQAFEFILPRKSAFHNEAQFVEDRIKEALATQFGGLPVAGMLLDIGLEPGIEDALATGFAVKTRIQIEHSSAQLKPRFAGHTLESFQPFRQQPHVPLIDGRYRQGRQDIAMVVHQSDHFLPFLVFVAAVANGLAPFLATVLEPSPWSKERSSL